MFHITILVIGSVNQKYLAEGINLYMLRLKPYARVGLEVIREVSFVGSTREQAKADEGARILKHLEKYADAAIYILDERGDEYTSVSFSKELAAVTSGHIVFVIGGSLGLDQKVLDRYPNHISLSQMTFTHEMTVVILLEQVYRAITIIKGKEYHH